MISRKKAVVALSLAASVLSSSALISLFSGSVQPAFARGSDSVTEELINGKTYCVSKVAVKASPDKVWQVLTDYDNADKVFPQLRKSKLMQDHGHSKVVKHVMAPTGLPGTYEYQVAVKESAPHSLEWHRVSGAFKQVDGHWKLEPLDGGHTTLVTYASYVDGGFLIPQALIRRQCRIDMPNVMSTLKTQAEGSHSVQIAGRPHSKNAQ